MRYFELFHVLGVLLLAGVLATGCEPDKDEVLDSFDEPVALAVGTAADPELLQVGNQPMAFVADQGNRAVARVDLQNRAVRTPLPLGRIPGAIAVHTTADVVDQIYVVDTSDGTLLGLTAAAALAPTVGTPTFEDAGAPSGVELRDLRAKPGRTPSQTWTVEYVGATGEWLVTGDGLGDQTRRATNGEPYKSDNKEVRFTVAVTGAAPDGGDRFTFTTDNGIREIDLGGRAVDVAVTPDESFVLVTTVNPPQLVAVDPADDSTFVVALPGAVTPAGISFSPNGSYAFISDRGDALIHVVDIGSASPGSYVVTNTPAPVSSRQIVLTPDSRRAYLLADDSNEVYAFDVRFDTDPPTFTPIDIIGLTPNIDPVPFPGGVRSIAAAAQLQTMRTGSAAYPVLVTTHAGEVRVLNGNTGCQDFADDRGARLDLIRFDDRGAPSLPTFEGEEFSTSKCGGVAQSETWELIYNEVLEGYDVYGSISGIQSSVAVEGTSYTSDRGEITVRIHGDETLPTTDGDRFSLTISDGTGPVSLGELPGDIGFYTLDDNGETKEYAIIANPGNDILSAVDIAERRVIVTYR